MIESLLAIVFGSILAICVAAIAVFLWRESRAVVKLDHERVLASAEFLYE